ncbi:MAG: hypothetical protein ACXVCY_09640 [Pseudobdellovibrionaceae bacterium]
MKKNNYLISYIRKILSVITIISSFFSSIAYCSVYEVSSSYTIRKSSENLSKTGQQQTYRVKGTGFLLSYVTCKSDFFKPQQCTTKYFLVTASHVSQGVPESLNVKLLDMFTNQNESGTLLIHQGNYLQAVVGRLADTWSDLEIIELNPSFVISQESRGIAPLVHCTLSNVDNEVICVNEFRRKSNNSVEINFPFNRNVQTLNLLNLGEYYGQMGTLEFFSTINSQISYNINATLKNEFDRANYYRWILENRFFLLPHSIIPGMSGSPLFAISALRDDVNINSRVLTGIGIQNDFDFHESLFASQFALSNLIQKYLKGEASQDMPRWSYDNSTYRTWKGFSERYSSKANTGGGGKSDMGYSYRVDSKYTADLFFENGSILGLRLNSDSNVAVWANVRALEFFKSKLENIDEIFPLFVKEDSAMLSDFLLEKTINTSMESANEVNYADADTEFHNCEISLDNKKNIFVKLTDKNLAKQLEFKLNSKGQYQTNGYFSPRLKLRATNNSEYIVDIRSLFFTDLDGIPSNEKGKFDKVDIFDKAREEGAKIKLRNISSMNKSTSELQCYLTSNSKVVPDE